MLLLVSGLALPETVLHHRFFEFSQEAKILLIKAIIFGTCCRVFNGFFGVVRSHCSFIQPWLVVLGFHPATLLFNYLEAVLWGLLILVFVLQLSVRFCSLELNASSLCALGLDLPSSNTYTLVLIILREVSSSSSVTVSLPFVAMPGLLASASEFLSQFWL